MSALPVKQQFNSRQLSKDEVAQLCCTYASLILHDDNQQVDDKKIAKIIAASGNKIEGFWPKLFSQVLNGKNIQDLILNPGSAGQQEAPRDAEVAQQAPAGKEAPKKEEKKVEEEEDMDMGGMFD